tara:strand:- start:2244 stop:3455 length:1212 start_codon:yes stop_codon:yes gene_type:complete
MESLSNLILEFGNPDALIDSWDNKSQRMAIWGFEDIFLYNSQGCFLNNKKIDGEPLTICNTILDEWSKTKSSDTYALGYLSYDLKNDLFPHLKLKPVKDKTLIWFGKPKVIKEYSLDEECAPTPGDYQLSIEKEIPDLDSYIESINKIKSYLQLGETYQINYSNPRKYFYEGCPFNLYLYLRNNAKPRNGFFLDTGEETILSLSPENFFTVQNNIIQTFPIKGTINRSDNIIEDKKLYNQLLDSDKDRAEHLMIVDLLRNDLGKICKYGTVETKNLYNIKSFETIHHMETEIAGELNKDIDFRDIILALFPGGSITGAPKERSIEIIDEVENYTRGIYTGAIGYLSSNDYMNFNIAIRTLNLKSKTGIYPVGGGIVWDSTAHGERKEALDKAKIMDNIKGEHV